MKGWFNDHDGVRFIGKGQATMRYTGVPNGLGFYYGNDDFVAQCDVVNIKFQGDSGLAWDFWHNSQNGIQIRFEHTPAGSLQMRIDLLEDGKTATVFQKDLDPSNPPGSVSLKVQWNKEGKQWYVWYGLEGAPPATEVPGSPFTTVSARHRASGSSLFWIHVIGSGAGPGSSADLDRFEIGPPPGE
jgi:hypothetical protein